MDPRLFFILYHFDECDILNMRLTCKKVRDYVDTKIIPYIEGRGISSSPFICYTDILSHLYYCGKYISLRALLKSPHIFESQKYLLYLFIMMRPKNMRDFDAAVDYHIAEINEQLDEIYLDYEEVITLPNNKIDSANLLYIIRELPQYLQNKLIELMRNKYDNSPPREVNEDGYFCYQGYCCPIKKPPISRSQQLAEFLDSYTEDSIFAVSKNSNYIKSLLTKLPSENNSLYMKQYVERSVLSYVNEDEILTFLNKFAARSIKAPNHYDDFSSIFVYLFRAKLLFYKRVEEKILEICGRFSFKIKLFADNVYYPDIFAKLPQNSKYRDPQMLEMIIKNSGTFDEESIITAAIYYNSTALFQKCLERPAPNAAELYIIVLRCSKLFRECGQSDFNIAAKFLAGLSLSTKKEIFEKYMRASSHIPIYYKEYKEKYNRPIRGRGLRSAYVYWFFNTFLFI